MAIVLRRLLAVFALVLLLANIGSVPLARAAVSDFTIESFEADYYLGRNEQKTSTLRVDETIVAKFPNFDQNRGILRAIPNTYQNHTVSLDILSVTDASGKAWKYTTEDQNDNTVLRIGDAGRYVRGLQTYKISYQMRNVTAFFDDHEEFYWDINGDQSLQPFGSVTARIHIPADVVGSLQDRQRCFAGAFEQTNEKSCTITRATKDGGVVVTAAAKNLRPHETLTVILAFDKDTFVLGPEIARAKLMTMLVIIAAIGGLVLPIIISAAWMYGRWRKFGKDPDGRGVIIPEYLPPKQFNAITSGAILRERVESKAISAAVVELAIKKYLHIYEIPKKGLLGKADYELEVIKDPSDLESEEMEALRMFFSDGVVVGARVKLSTLANKLYAKMPGLSKNVCTRLFNDGYFATDPDKIRSQYRRIGAVPLIIGFVILFLVITIPFGIGLIISGLMILLAAGVMPARSQKGVELRDYLYGLRDYMKLAEADRIKVLQSPEGAEKLPKDIDPKNPKSLVKLFEKLLPYAMLFGIEKEWAKQFEHLYKQPPDWYSGNWKTFSAVHLASSLGGFGAASTTSFTSPNSSSSSGFSSGGGFSGGGGGGGGVGGW